MADQKISQLTSYTTPLDADVLPVVDTANTTTKKTTWANIKATLVTYFNTIYATIASPTFTGTVTIPENFKVGTTTVTTSGAELNHVDGVTSNIQTQLDAKIAKSIIDAKGDLIVGTASDTSTRLAVGADGKFLKADSGATEGVSWGDAIASADIQTFTSSGTWTKPSGAKKVLVQMWGAGASGAKGTNTAGGGGGGEYSEFMFDAGDLSSTETVTIGTGGALRTTTGSGNDGGDTTFGSKLTADGGRGGTSQNSGVASQGGQGGNKFGNLNTLWGVGVTSADGGDGLYSGAGGGTDTGANGYDGGDSCFGGAGGGGESDIGTSFGDGVGGTSVRGGNGGNGARNGNATAGSTPGGGGGANTGTGNSGAGGSGKAIVTTFF